MVCYDNGNNVTSVHPEFYSKRLRQHTDLLVYVPYFVCVGKIPEEFCVCAGTMFANKVVLESESVRENYISAFRQFETKHKLKGRFGDPESKLVALGSPKLDKVADAGLESHFAPDEWEKLLRRPDGTRKKAVLYNTTLVAFLQGESDAYYGDFSSLVTLYQSAGKPALIRNSSLLHENKNNDATRQLGAGADETRF